MDGHWIQADFNGLFADGDDKLLCISHSDLAHDAAGNPIQLRSGMHLTAYEEDCDDDGRPADLIASGVVEPSPPWLTCRGSRWVLRVDHYRVRHVPISNRGIP